MSEFIFKLLLLKPQEKSSNDFLVTRIQYRFIKI